MKQATEKTTDCID